MISDGRREFLTDILTMAIENGGHGWFSVEEYVWSRPDTEPYALVVEGCDGDNDDERHRITFDVIRKGLGIIGKARIRETERDGWVLHNVSTEQRLYMSRDMQTRIMRASRENHAGDLDAIDALAIVECGLFGAVTYA